MCLFRLSDLFQAKLRSQTTVFPNPTAIIKESELGKHQRKKKTPQGETRPRLGTKKTHTIRPSEKRGNVQPPSGILGLIHPLKNSAKVKYNTTSKNRALIPQFVAEIKK